MALKIDPDAAPLYEEIKPVQARFKNVIKQQSVEHMAQVLGSIFGSSPCLSSNYDKYHNSHETITWKIPILAPSIGAVFNAILNIHLDDDSNATHVDINDQWIYKALLPLGLKIELHGAWRGVLTYATKLIDKPTSSAQLPLFNLWDEAVLIEQLGWKLDEDEPATIFPVSEQQACFSRSAMQALFLQSSNVSQAWPNVAPFLNAVHVLVGIPEETEDWVPWASAIKQQFLMAPSTNALKLPGDLLDTAGLHI